MLGIFFRENHLISRFETWWADCSPWKEVIALFFIFFLALLGVPARNFGTISVFRHFLHNGLWDLAEIWPEASLNVSARFPATFPAINEFPFLLVGFGCPWLYADPALFISNKLCELQSQQIVFLVYMEDSSEGIGMWFLQSLAGDLLWPELRLELAKSQTPQMLAGIIIH